MINYSKTSKSDGNVRRVRTCLELGGRKSDQTLDQYKSRTVLRPCKNGWKLYKKWLKGKHLLSTNIFLDKRR